MSFLDKKFLVNLYSKYNNELCSDRFQSMCYSGDGQLDGNISHLDGELIYLLIRELNLQNGIEFSSGSGFSTAFVVEGLRKNRSDRFATFDLERGDSFNDRSIKFNFVKYFYHEEAILGILKYIHNQTFVGQIDLLVVDSCHEGWFAQKYTRQIWPLLSPNCIIFIHDMCYKCMNLNQFSNYGLVHPSEICGTSFSKGEAEVLRNYFGNIDNDYVMFSTHRMFGQSHDYSTELPRNNELCESIFKVYPKFQFPACQLSGGSPRPPMSLVTLKSNSWGALESIY